MSLYLNEEKKQVVNFDETAISITVDLTADVGTSDFNVDVEREKANKIKGEIEFSEFVHAFRCSDNKTEIMEHAPIAQGGMLNVCVASTDTSVLKIGSVESMLVKQDGEIKFEAIKDGEVTVSSLVNTDCANNICMVKMIVIGTFFAVEEPGEINVFGNVELNLVGAAKRRFLEEKNEMIAPEDKVTSVFDMNVLLDTYGSVSKGNIKNYTLSVWLFASIIFGLL